MSTMRYVGARYVPKWYVNSVDQTANWEINVEYEPLTWVTTPNNHLYLSKKTVPDNIGTPAQNTAYWLDMGQMTGDLQNIQDEIDAITANMGDLSNLLTTDKTSLVNAINEVLQGGGGSPSARKFVMFGDSYGTDYETGGVQYYGWWGKLQTLMGLTASQIVHECVIGGLGFMGSQENASSQWMTTLNTYTQDDSVTDVCFIGGDNDIAHQTNLSTLITQTLTMAKSKFPNAKIWVGFCACDLSLDNIHPIMSCFQKYSVGATTAGAILMQGLQYALYNISYMRLPSHPNNTGTSILAGAIKAALEGGRYVNIIPPTKITNDPTDVNVAVGNPTTIPEAYFAVNDKDITVTFEGDPDVNRSECKIILGNPYQFDTNASRPLNFIKCTNVPFPNQGRIVLGTTRGFLKGNILGWRECTLVFMVYNNLLQVGIWELSTGGNFLQDTISEVHFPTCKFTVDLIRYSEI